MRQLLVADRAGDSSCSASPRERALAQDGQDVRFRLFKNNVDSFGNSYGCHENHLVARDQDLPALVDVLTPSWSPARCCALGQLSAGEF